HNAFVRAPGDKFLQHFFRDHQTVDPLPAQFKIFRTHAAGKVDGDDNIDAARCDFRLALAKLGPGEGETKITASGIDIVIAIDLSGSMSSEDFELRGQRVNRLMIAKEVLQKFIARRPNERIV